MDPNKIDRGKLKRLIKKHFSLDDLNSLCFELSIPFESLPGEGTIDAKARELIVFSERNDNLDHLIEKLREDRPHVNWDMIFILNPHDEVSNEAFEIPENNQFFLSQLCELLFEKFKRVWLTYSAWLIISALGFIASLVQVFGLTCSTRFLLFSLLALVGGGMIISCGWFSNHNPPLADWDKILATVLWLISSLLLVYFSTQCKPTSLYIIRIVNQNGEPIPNARVSLQSGTVQIPDAISDVNGISRFFIDDIPDGAVAQVIVSMSNCPVHTININTDKSQQVPHTIQLNCAPQTPTAASTSFVTATKTDTPTLTSTPTSTNIPTPTSIPTPPDSCPIAAVEFSRDGGQLLPENKRLQLNPNQLTEVTARIETLLGCSVSVTWQRTGGQFQLVGSQPCDSQVCKSLPTHTFQRQGKEFSEFEVTYMAPEVAGTYDISVKIEASSSRTGRLAIKTDHIIVEVR